MARGTLQLKEKRISVIVRRVGFRRLPLIYTIYFEAFNDNVLQSVYDFPKREIKRMTVIRTIAIRLIHVLLARLSVAARIGSILPLVQTQWDPIPFEIIANGEVIGCCFLVRLSSEAIELGMIGILKDRRGLGIGAKAVEAVKNYARETGFRRIVTGSGPRGTGGFFKKCGFKEGFSEYVFHFVFT
jgi:GNAT superfamily N-acetyltransferase